MSNGTREKQALGVFLILIVLSTFGIAWYMVAGHSWNVAASSIDEKVGQMEGYTSIVYAGTLPVQVDAKTLDSQNGSDTQLEDGQDASDAAEQADKSVSGSGSASASSGSSDAAASSVSSSGAGTASSFTDENASESGVSSSAGTGSSTGSNSSSSTGSGTSSNSASSKSSSSKSSSGSSKSADGAAGQTHNDEASGLTSDVGSVAAPVPDDSDGDDAESNGSSESTTVLKAATVRGGMDVAKAQPVTPEEVQTNYEDKGATVLVLDTADPSQYGEGVILKRGTKRIGVFSVDVPLSEKAAEARIKYFRDCKVDLVVCISSVRTYVRNLQGADIVITLQDEEVSTMGGNSNGSFFVNAPHVDSVGTILVSPSNVVSAKVIESL